LAIGNDAVLKIELSGPGAQLGVDDGLKLDADKCEIKGLVISKWDNGVYVVVGATENKVRGNF
jgi:hypothetical protein